MQLFYYYLMLLQLVCLKRYKVKTMSEGLKTIKELADELGVSKQAIQYHIKSLTNKNRQTKRTEY